MVKIDPKKIREKGTILKRHGRDYEVKLDNGIIISASTVSRFRVPRVDKRGHGTKRPTIIQGDRVLIEIPLNQTKIKVGSIIAFIE